MELNQVEARVLGSLIEKEMSTPEYYPLSLNALTNSCNQKNNRDPVVSYDQDIVAGAIESLIGKQVVYRDDTGRVSKYGHNFTKLMGLLRRETAILCVLMLRGPQTPGELRARTERLRKFEDLEDVDRTVRKLMEAGHVARLPRQPGRKESRYAHLFSGEPDGEHAPEVSLPEPDAAKARPESDRLDELEKEVGELREEMERLRRDFLEFKAQFE